VEFPNGRSRPLAVGQFALSRSALPNDCKREPDPSLPAKSSRGRQGIGRLEADIDDEVLTSKSALHRPHGITGRARIGTGWSDALQQAELVETIGVWSGKTSV
jgi:hypothetical protein